VFLVQIKNLCFLFLAEVVLLAKLIAHMMLIFTLVLVKNIRLQLLQERAQNKNKKIKNNKILQHPMIIKRRKNNKNLLHLAMKKRRKKKKIMKMDKMMNE
jgi:hypothetical protein